MPSTLRKSSVFKLPRIRTKDEFFKVTSQFTVLLSIRLQTAPEIAALFGEAPLGEDVFPIVSARAGSPVRRASPSPRRHSIDSPRLYEDTANEDEETLAELEDVKKERSLLMRSIAHFKRSSVATGGEVQENDIRQLKKELELKKHKLNEMRQEAKSKESELTQLMNASTDCERLMLSNRDCLMQYVDQLNTEMSTVKEDLVEIEAKNRLYTLLGERTR